MMNTMLYQRILSVLILNALVLSAPCLASDLDDKLANPLAQLIKSHRGVVTVCFKDLATGQVYSVDASRPMPSASMIKFPVMLTAYEKAALGELDLDRVITLEEDDKVPGSGILTPHFSDGATIRLRDAIRLMMAWSDNTATNLVVDAVGIKAVNNLMDKLGCSTTRLNSKVYRRDTTVNPKLSEEFGLGRMSAEETVTLFEKLANKDPFGAGAGKPYGKSDAKQISKYCEEMMDHLYACQYRDMVPLHVPADIKVAHKGGAVSRARCDGGIIQSSHGPILYCVMTAENEDRSWSDSNEACLLAAEIGKAVYQYFASPDGVVEPPSVARILSVGADGPLVEALQRTINARLKKGPRLGVDGDFGPNTESGVKRFQTSVGLEPSGKVDVATWKALGTLIMEDESVPPPSEVKRELPSLKPQDSLTGPPVTTCKAWAIADGKTGKVLWDHEGDIIRDPASTTKMMTAYVILSMAKENPDLLSEIITFSERADKTSGSTAGVRVGEKISVKELLYGLMLPSGNDASVAFAETIGKKIDLCGETSYDRFISAMNAEAKELGMLKTGYRNPHGLTAEGHVTTAKDLVKLAHAAMKDALFREVVATRLHGSTLDSVDGYQRNVLWKNTDRLLQYEGYYGIKTGTTGPAGACLVSAGERNGKPLIVVILGATSSDARYVDARNLYRWAWSELEK